MFITPKPRFPSTDPRSISPKKEEPVPAKKERIPFVSERKDKKHIDTFELGKK